MKNNFCIIIFVLLITLNNYSASAKTINEDPNLDIYKINTSLADSYDIKEKGETVNLILLTDISTEKKENSTNPVNFEVYNNENLNIKANGFITMSQNGSRLSMLSSIEIATNKLYLDDGQEIPFAASSPLFNAIHPPHVDSSSPGIAKAISFLSISGSPLTFGASLGINFLSSALLSAYHNGLSDFVWGGLHGVGLSPVENILRKQPDLYLSKGTVIPFTLKEDLKINQGITKEKIENININKEDAISKIEKLIKQGDITGALEFSIKTGQKEVYDELLKKISS